MTSDRDKLAARIRALSNMTVANGCTEDEAVSAAAKLAELLTRYNMTLDEAKLRETQFAHHSERHEDVVGERLWKVADAISFLTGARYWTSRAGVWPIEINFFGFEHEVEVARYLSDICARSMRQEHRRLKRSFSLLNSAAQRRWILPYLDGMMDSLWRRIRALKIAEPAGSGLIVLRDDLVDAAMKAAGHKTEQGRGRQSRDFEAAYRDGEIAGERVSLNQGIRGSTSGLRMING